MQYLHTRIQLLKPWLAALIAAAALGACGGGSDGGAQTPAGESPSNASAPDASTPSAPSTPSPSAAGAAAPPPTSADLSCGLPNFSQDLLDRVNAARTAAATACRSVVQPKVAVVNWDAKLAAAAGAHSQDMAARSLMTHTGANGSSAGDRVTAQGYRWNWWSENVAAGQGSAASVMSAWLGSTSGHCEAIMAREAAHVAVACVKSSNGTPYWTMVLARPAP